MCRLTVYKGRPMLIGDLITNPNNSLILQSRDAAYHPLVLDRSHRRNILVNGDGFGVAWYGNNIDKGSCLFKFVTPAWSNANLRNIGDHVDSSLIFAHIRAASSGHDPLEHVAVSHENCHPFKHGSFTFMHNGGIPNFSKIKLKLLNKLLDPFFQEIKGSTDSEHIFALLLTYLFTNRETIDTTIEKFKVEEIASAMQTTISTIITLMKDAGITDPCSLNCCVTDGVNIVVTRFRNGSSCPPSLYYNFGSNFACEDGVFLAKGGTTGPSDIVISSAPLSKVRAYQPSSLGCGGNGSVAGTNTTTGSSEESEHDISEEDIGSWILMPKNHMLIVRGDVNDSTRVTSVKLEPIIVNGNGPVPTPISTPNSSVTSKSSKSGKSGPTVSASNSSIIRKIQRSKVIVPRTPPAGAFKRSFRKRANSRMEDVDEKEMEEVEEEEEVEVVSDHPNDDVNDWMECSGL